MAKTESYVPVQVKSVPWVFAALLFDEALASLDETIVSTALPTVVGAGLCVMLHGICSLLG